VCGLRLFQRQVYRKCLHRVRAVARMPIIPAPHVSPIPPRGCTVILSSSGCNDYSSVRRKSNRCTEMIHTTLCKSDYIDYASVW
jgi:hypothetical protein